MSLEYKISPLIIEQILRSSYECSRKTVSLGIVENPETYKVILIPGLGKLVPNPRKITKYQKLNEKTKINKSLQG